MKLIRVIDTLGKEVVVDEESRKLMSFNNKERKIVYNAKICENGVETEFYTDYNHEGTIDSVTEKLKVWNNSVMLMYAVLVEFDRKANDKDNKLYDRLVEFVENNESLFFTKSGDFRKRFLIKPQDIKKLIK